MTPTRQKSTAYDAEPRSRAAPPRWSAVSCRPATPSRAVLPPDPADPAEAPHRGAPTKG